MPKKKKKTYKKKPLIKKKQNKVPIQRPYRPSIPRPSIPQPVSHAGSLATERAKTVAVSVMVANPLVAAIAIIIGLAIVFIVGGLTLLKVISILSNPFFWVAAILLAIIIRPKSMWRIIGSSFLVGGIFWIWETYNAYQEAKTICSTPIFGQLICNSAGLFDWLYWYPIYMAWGVSLVMHIGTAFMVLTALSYLRYALLKGTRMR